MYIWQNDLDNPSSIMDPLGRPTLELYRSPCRLTQTPALSGRSRFEIMWCPDRRSNSGRLSDLDQIRPIPRFRLRVGIRIASVPDASDIELKRRYERYRSTVSNPSYPWDIPAKEPPPPSTDFPASPRTISIFYWKPNFFGAAGIWTPDLSILNENTYPLG